MNAATNGHSGLTVSPRARASSSASDEAGALLAPRSGPRRLAALDATDVARRMVGLWGMIDAVGPVSVLPTDHPPGFPGTNGTSEATQELVDSEVRRIIEEAHQDARRLLAENRDKLDSLAEFRKLTADDADPSGAPGRPGRPAVCLPLDALPQPKCDLGYVDLTADRGRGRLMGWWDSRWAASARLCATPATFRYDVVTKA